MAVFSFKKGYFEKRIEYLEEVNRKIQASLDAIKGRSDFQQKIGNKYNLDVIFKESRNRILDLIDFKVVAFLLYDLQTYDFKLAHIYPEFLKSDLTIEIDNQIESGNFAWAISQKTPVFVQPSVLEPNFDLILHTLLTENAVMGML